MRFVRLSGQADATQNPAADRTSRAAVGAWLGVVGILLLFIALRWNNFNAPLIRDEGEYAYAAQLLRHGIVPYTHSFLQKPPMIIYSYALADAILPHVFWAPRLLAYLFVALATGLLGFIARREFGASAALPAMWLMTPMVLLPEIQQFTANTEMFMLLPLLATVAIYVSSRQGSGRAGHWLAAGFLAAVTFFYKYTACPIFALIFIAWSMDEWRIGKNLWRIGQHWLSGILGAGIASAAILAFFLRDHGLRELWECTVVFNHAYAASGNFSLTGFSYLLQLFWSDWTILFLLAGVMFFQRRPRIWFWVGMFLAAWLSTNASIYSHYYILIMPFWALLAAVAINRLAALSTAFVSRPLPWLAGALAALVVLLVCLPDASVVAYTPTQFDSNKVGMGNPFLESELAARRVAELTAPQDYVFVAGSEPQILYYARRFSPTRFVIVYPMMIATPLAAGYQREAIRDLEERPPAVIVASYSYSSWLSEKNSPPFFDDYLHQLIGRKYDCVGGYVIDGAGGHWEEPLTGTNEDRASLTIFKRRSFASGATTIVPPFR